MKAITVFVTIFGFILTSPAFSQTTVEDPATTKQGKFSIGIMASPDICYRSLFNNNGSETSDMIIDLRNDVESVKVGFTAGMDAAYELNNNFTILSGLYYSKKGYRIGKQDLFFGDQVDPRYGFVYDTTSGLNGKLETVKFSYNYHYLDIPIQVSYITGRKKIKWISSLGLTTNILIKSTNRVVLKYENNEKEVKVQEQPYGFHTMNLSATISSGIDYELNKKISLRAAPSFQYNLFKMIDTPITMRLWSAGLNISCRYYI